jgi:hypothetical protein
MTGLVPAQNFNVDVLEGFFAPVSHSAIDELIMRRNHIKKEIESLCHIVNSNQSGAMGYLIKANLDRDSHMSPAGLFDVERGIKQLDSDMWHSAMRLTDVWEYMPQARRSQWHTQLTAWKEARGYKQGENPANDMLPFEREVVVETIKQLLMMRTQFFSEKVDGIFRGLSGEHVTNSPMGFGKRMIIADASSYGRCGLIDDLRTVIAKFRGLDEKLGISSSDIMRNINTTGDWYDVDGGSLRIRLYKVGTAHLEVHEDISWKLNKVLGAMHPLAIPSEFREPSKKKKKLKAFDLFDDLLPSSVRFLIGAMRTIGRNNYYFTYGQDTDNAKLSEAAEVLRAVGGVEATKEFPHGRWGEKIKRKVWSFDYNFEEIRIQLAAHGRIPNVRSHQFYPTPKELAEIAVELAMIDSDDTMSWLEPSAGQGGLAEFMPKEQTTCIEISKLHCEILEAKGFKVIHADFMKISVDKKYDRIVMNPPFSEGRWQAHVEHAANMITDKGLLVAIVPASAKDKFKIDGYTVSYSDVYENMFVGASVDVVILQIKKQ